MGQSTQKYLKCCFLICFLVFKVLFSGKIQYSFAKYIQYFNLMLTQQKFVLMKTSSRRSLSSSSGDIFMTSSRGVFNTVLKRSAKTIMYRNTCLGHTSEKLMIRVQNFQEWTLVPKLFKTVSLKYFMKWLLLQPNVLLLKSGIRKDVAFLINKEPMNQNSSKDVFLRF